MNSLLSGRRVLVVEDEVMVSLGSSAAAIWSTKSRSCIAGLLARSLERPDAADRLHDGAS